MADYLRLEGDGVFWDVQLRRPLHDWELLQFMDLLEVIYGVCEVGLGEDALIWTGEVKGDFSVSSFYKVLSGTGTESFPWQSIWVPGVPTKVSFFVWSTALGRILTIDNLIRCRQILVNWCYMCRSNAESISHLLFHCPVAHELWCVALALFGMTWVQPSTIKEVLWSWRGGRVEKRKNEAGGGCLFVLCG